MSKAKIKVSKNTAVNWRNNGIQFPRLIAELEATGALTLPVLDKVAEEMDLDRQSVYNLVDRAQNVWDGIKADTFTARALLD